MKNIVILIITIVSVIFTFIFAELFSIYHFGDIPTLLSTFYLVSIFSIFEYILLTISYIIIKLKQKNKIKIKEIFGRILLFLALILILLFGIVLEVDWLNWYVYSSPFYINIIVRILQFIIPALLLILISIVLIKNSKK